MALAWVLALLLGWSAPAAAAPAGTVSEREVTFESDEVTLSGTVLLPDGPAPVPGLVLVHGAGPHDRDSLRAEAEAFSRLGVAVLIYDKRTRGYSQLDRSYALLADDARSAVATLRGLPQVDADAVGMWGLSEGAWVAPLAAIGNSDVAFLITVGAAGVPPLQQTSWALANNLDDQGVTGSVRRTVTWSGLRLLAALGVFPEAHFDPVPGLEQLPVPTLAIWGARDRTAPPAESARVAIQAMDRSDGPPLSVRIFREVGHGLRSTDGSHLADGYPETVAAWIGAVGDGQPPADRDDLPQQDRTSRVLPPMATGEMVLIVLAGLLAFSVFTGELVGVLLHVTRRGRPAREPRPSSARQRGVGLVAAVGLASMLGFLTYYGYLLFTEAAAVGPVLGGRPLVWLALQVLAVLTCVLGASLTFGAVANRHALSTVGRRHVVLVLVAGTAFAGWAAYWGLLVP